MKIRYARPHAALALGALVLLGGSFAAAPARAQDAGAASDKPITLNLQNVPIKTALQLLFKSAGITNFNIASDVQGSANISVNAPFSVALTQLLNSANATFSVENGSYNVTIKRPTPPPTPAITPTGTTVVGGGPESDTSGLPRKYYPIPINKYDAYYIAYLLGATGVVKVDVNGVLPSSFGGSTTGQGGQGGFGGQGGPAGGITSVGGGFGGSGGGGFGGSGGGGFGGGRGGGFGGGGGGYGGGGGGGARGLGGFATMNSSGQPSSSGTSGQSGSSGFSPAG